MRPERRQSETPNGGKWEFSSRNTNITPTNETFEITDRHLPPHFSLVKELAKNYLGPQWKPRALIQRSPWGEEGLPSLFFVFENPLITKLTAKRPNFLSALKEDYEDDVFGPNRRAGLPVMDSVKKALAGTNLSCLYITVEFNEIKRKKGLLRREENVYQNGVVFFELGFIPLGKAAHSAEVETAKALEHYNELRERTGSLVESIVENPQPIFVAPPSTET